MPTLEEVTGPYEWLVRWDHITRTLQGQHYQTATSILRDGVIVPGATSINPPMPITSETAPTIAEVCEVLNIVALARISELEGELTARIIERDQAVAIAAQMRAERDAAVAPSAKSVPEGP